MSNLHNPGIPLPMYGRVPPASYSQTGIPLHSVQQQGHGYGLNSHYPYSPAQDRPFKCDECPQSFNRNHDLKRHSRIHLAVKPFPCSHCDKSFSRKDALKRHKLVKGCG
ncbi:hypothetical protein QBC37DRAFT_248936, partial [Rhypophila decipiens]